MKKSKKELQEELDTIEQMGQESEEKGKKATKQILDERAREEKKKEEQLLFELDAKRKQRASYKQKLLYFLHMMISEIQFPQGYQWGVWFDGKGIRLTVVDYKYKKYQRAFIPNYDPKYDLNACYMFAIWVQDIIDAKQSELYIPPGIWTPPLKPN